MFHAKQAAGGSSEGGSFPLRSARLRLLRAPAAAFRFGRRGFGCFVLRRQLSASVGAASAASGSGGSFPLRSARLRLHRAPLGAGRCSSSGFVCSALLGLLCFGRRWAAPLCLAPSAILRFAIPVAPFDFALIASAQPRRSALRCLRHCLPPLQAAAFALRCLRHYLPPLQAAAFAAAPCRLFRVKHYRLLNNLQTHQSNSIFANNH